MSIEIIWTLQSYFSNYITQILCWILKDIKHFNHWKTSCHDAHFFKWVVFITASITTSDSNYSKVMCNFQQWLYPPNNEVVGGYIGFTPSVRLSVRPSVRPSRLPCPPCNIYSSGWILSIFATNDHYHERVCRTQWPLTLTYIFKVIRPWLRKLCPLCSVYSSG